MNGLFRIGPTEEGRPTDHDPNRHQKQQSSERVHLPGLALTQRGSELRFRGGPVDDVVYTPDEHQEGDEGEPEQLPLLRGIVGMPSSDVVDLQTDLSRFLSRGVALGNSTCIYCFKVCMYVILCHAIPG